MTATAHALVAGAIVARFTGNPAAAVTLAFTSHYIMDSIPHWDFGTNWRNRPKKTTGIYAICETIVGIACSYVIFGQKESLLLWAAAVFVSLLPDWLETPWYIFFAHPKKPAPAASAGLLEKLAFSLYKLPNVFHTKAQLPFGLLTQVVTVGFFLYLLK